MNSQLRRLFLAAGLSGLGFAVTLFWYHSTQNSNFQNQETPLAQVGSVSDEVLRRPPTRLLWHSVNTGDSLFNGEAIRTSQDGEVRIQFEDGRFIDLEADSLIVLSKAEGEISLDLMEGSLFVNSQATAAAADGTEKSGLVLNSADGKVDLSRASASLSKTEGKKLNLQVVEGSASLQSKDGKTQEIQKGTSGTLGSQGIQFDSKSLKIISPLPNKSVFMDPSKKPDVNFKWQGFPTDWNVTLVVGQNRKQLKPTSQLSAGSTDTTVTLPIGRHYWKLKASNPANPAETAESSVYRLDVMARNTPTPLSPTANAQLEFEQLPTEVIFQWQASEEISGLIIEVARDAQLRNKVKVQRVEQSSQFSLPDLAAGDYFWRLSSFFPDSPQPISGPIQRFSILQKVETGPTLVKVDWINPESKQYFVDNPEMKLSWSAGDKTSDVAQWKVSWKNMSDPEMEPGQIETSETQLNTQVAKPGRFLATVEAYDKKGRLMGTSLPLELALESQPLLPSPTLLPEAVTLKAGSDGRSELNWTAVDGAQEYLLKVINPEGREVFKKNLTTLKTTVTNLMPGQYTIEIQSIDRFGRLSANMTPRPLIVPDKSNLRAPAVKKAEVKK